MTPLGGQSGRSGPRFRHDNHARDGGVTIPRSTSAMSALSARHGTPLSRTSGALRRSHRSPGPAGRVLGGTPRARRLVG